MSATVKIILHGNLKQFGGPFDWGVKTPKEAIRALCIMREGFEAFFSKGQYRLIRGKKKNGASLTEPMIGINLAAGSELHIIPAAKGSGGGTGKVILGAVLIAAAFVTAGTSLVASAGAAGALGATAGVGIAGVAASIGFKIGIFMVLDGVSQLLAPTKKSIPADAQKSFTLNPPTNMTEQGNPVPLVYGQVRIGSVQVSAGYSTSEIAIGTNAPVGSPYYIPGYTPGSSNK